MSSQFQLVKFSKNGVNVEVICKPGMVTKYREGKCGLNDCLVDDRIYSDSSKGDVAKEADLAKLGAKGHELLELIVKTGQYSLTAAEKREAVEKKRLEVVNYIHETYVDSTTGRPHPVTRIEAALTEIKAQYDPAIETERLVHSLIPKLQVIIRLQESIIEGTVKVPVNKVGQVIGICYNLGTVVNQEYGSEHAFIKMKVTPGKYDALIDQIGRASGGQAVFQIAGALATQESNETETTKVRKTKGRGKGGKH